MSKHDDDLPPLPPLHVLEAFREQDTKATRLYAHRFAVPRAKMLAKLGVIIDAAELVNDTFSGIYLGEIAWEPNRDRLLARVCYWIRQTTWNKIRGEDRHPHVSIDSFDDPEQAEQLVGTARSGRQPDEVMAVVLAFFAEEMGYITPSDDVRVNQILACWRNNVVSPAEIMACTGMDLSDYKAARLRIGRSVPHLPRDVQAVTRSLLRDGPRDGD